MPHQWYTYAQWITLFLVVVLSLRKGDDGERYGAGLILITNMIAFFAFVANAQSPPQILLFWLDFILASGLLLITFCFTSLWLGAAMLLQSIVLFAHALALDDGEISSFTFIVTNNVVTWLMYACLLGATLMSWRARSHGSGLQSGKGPRRAAPSNGTGTLAL